jgi:predicted dehydrogenase
VWDEIEERGRRWAEELNCAYIADYDAILADPNIDSLIICAPTNLHYDLLIRAARAKKNIFCEKVLTLSTAQALEVKRAIADYGVKFCIPLFQKLRAGLQTAKRIADSGALGTINYVRVRNAHDGSIQDWLPEHFYNPEQCGGGAMIDLGAHPVYLINWFLGKPLTVRAAMTNITVRAVEDNAVCLTTHSGGAIGVAETGFCSQFNPLTVNISGTKGALMAECDKQDDRVTYATAETDGKWVLCEDMADALKSPMLLWIDYVLDDVPITAITIDEAVALTQVLEAAYQSFETSSVVTLP